MGTQTAERKWLETTYGARWMNTPSPHKYQIWQMSCVHCDFKIEPSQFRAYDEHRKDHPQPYGNFASISHARKVMREHVAGCKFTPTNGNIYRCSVCGKPSYDCVGAAPTPEP